MAKTVYNTQIADRINAVFKQLDWRFRFDHEHGIFRTGVSIDGPITDIQIFIDVREDDFLVIGISPIRPDIKKPEMMARMAEFIARANYGLKNGCFELDYQDGEIRYRCYVDCDGVLPSDEVIIHCIFITQAMIKRYASGIANMIFTDQLPADAIEECEDDL